MSTARIWDGVGPKRECLLRVTWGAGGVSEWMHFDWRDADASGYNDGEGEYEQNPDEYFNEAASVTISQGLDGYARLSERFDEIRGADFAITHWAELPELP